MLILGLMAIGILIYLAMQSNFAQHYKKAGDAESYKIKSKYAKELYYSKKFKRSKNSDEILSLGDFTVNIDQSKLIMKVSVDADEDTIESFMKNQSVVRDDVINSVIKLRGKKVDQDSVSDAIKSSLNSRFRRDKVRDVYFETFLKQ